MQSAAYLNQTLSVDFLVETCCKKNGGLQVSRIYARIMCMRTMQPVKYTFDVILPEILLRVIVGTFNITRDEVLVLLCLH